MGAVAMFEREAFVESMFGQDRRRGKGRNVEPELAQFRRADEYKQGRKGFLSSVEVAEAFANEIRAW